MIWVEFRGRTDKLFIMAQLFRDYLRGRVLDLGCDTKALREFISGTYIGVDFIGKPDIQSDLTYGIPIKDQAVDCVVAMDVLEHLDDIHYAFDEICRVSRKYAIIGLPNLYEWSFRLKFLMGKRLSGKYGLPLEPPTDRHRWLFSLREAREFIYVRAQKNGFMPIREVYGFYKYKKIIPKLLARIGRLFGERGVNLWAYHYWVVLERRHG